MRENCRNHFNRRKREFPAEASEEEEEEEEESRRLAASLPGERSSATSAGEAKWRANAQTSGRVSEESKGPNQEAPAASRRNKGAN